MGRLFAACSSTGDGYGDGSTKAAISVPLSGTQLRIYRPMYLIFSSCISIADVFIFLHIFFHTHPPPTPSSHIYFVYPIVLPLYNISYDAISVVLCPHRRIHCHPYPLSLSFSVSDSSVLINLYLPCCYHPPPSPPYRISKRCGSVN